MDNTRICQSCGMPILDASFKGTEKDGSLSPEYCKFCYQGGQFTEPGMTLEKMRSQVQSIMQHEEMTSHEVRVALDRLPLLKRWRKAHGHPTPVTPVTTPAELAEKQPLQEPAPPGPLVESEEELDTISGGDTDVILPGDILC